VIDFSKQSEKQKLFDILKKQQGPTRIDIRPFAKDNSRYKYYFAHVLIEILRTGIYLWPDDLGNLARATQTTQIHEMMKFRYNKKVTVDPFTGDMYSIGGGSTTGMSDSEFINNFQEQIIADHSGEPFYIEFLSKEEWAILLKGKSNLQLS
jgi:hypothetical protein